MKQNEKIYCQRCKMKQAWIQRMWCKTCKCCNVVLEQKYIDEVKNSAKVGATTTKLKGAKND